jgi:cytochrome c
MSRTGFANLLVARLLVARLLVARLLVAGYAAAGMTSASAHTAEDVQALVERAAAHIRQVGRPQAFADFSRPDGGFTDGELYVFCDDAQGVVLAHGDNPKLIGRSLIDVHDAEGHEPTREMLRVGQAKGSGWVEYLWPNAVEGRIQRKDTYVIRIDDQTICASGYYKPDQP